MRDTQEHATDPSAVIAEYADMASAREAVEALQFAGVEAARIRLEGEAARRAAGATPKNTNKTDGPMTGRILGRAMIWGTVGLIVGTLLGRGALRRGSARRRKRGDADRGMGARRRHRGDADRRLRDADGTPRLRPDVYATCNRQR